MFASQALLCLQLNERLHKNDFYNTNKEFATRKARKFYKNLMMYVLCINEMDFALINMNIGYFFYNMHGH